MNGEVWLAWHAARAAGMVAWGLSASSVLWGLALSTRAFGQRPRPAWLFDLHQFLGGMTLTFTAIHVGAVLLDEHLHVGLLNVLVPFTGDRSVAAVWGVVALYLLVAVELTSLARAHVSKRLWRGVHVAGLVLFAAATAHGLAAGTDAGSLPFLVTVFITCCAVAALTSLRLIRWIRRPWLTASRADVETDGSAGGPLARSAV